MAQWPTSCTVNLLDSIQRNPIPTGNYSGRDSNELNNNPTTETGMLGSKLIMGGVSHYFSQRSCRDLVDDYPSRSVVAVYRLQRQIWVGYPCVTRRRIGMLSVEDPSPMNSSSKDDGSETSLCQTRHVRSIFITCSIFDLTHKHTIFLHELIKIRNEDVIQGILNPCFTFRGGLPCASP